MTPPGMPPGTAYPPPRPGQPGGPPAWQRAIEHRPGIIPLRPLGLGDIYTGVTRMIRGNPAATLGLAFVVSLAFLAPTTMLAAWLSGQISFEVDADPADTTADILGSVASAIPTLATNLATVLLAGFVGWITGQAVLGRKVTAGQTWEGARPYLLRLIGATLLVGLAVYLAVFAIVALPIVWLAVGQPTGGEAVLAVIVLMLAGLLAVAFFLFLWTRLAFVNPVIVLEAATIGRGLRRSWALTAGRQFWRVFGIRLLTAVIVATAAAILTLPLSLVTTGVLVATGDYGQLYLWQAIINGVTGLITATLTTPVTAGVDAVLYVDERIRREGLDVQLLEQIPASTPLRQA